MDNKYIGKDIHIVANKMKRKIDAATQGYDITHNQFQILLFIFTQNKDIYQKDIENAFNLRRSTISKLLSLLEKKKFISKSSVKTDARLKKIVITEKGIEQINMFKSVFKKFNNYLVSNIDPYELEVFYKVLKKLSQLTN